jgi:hypothetical protein
MGRIENEIRFLRQKSAAHAQHGARSRGDPLVAELLDLRKWRTFAPVCRKMSNRQVREEARFERQSAHLILRQKRYGLDMNQRFHRGHRERCRSVYDGYAGAIETAAMDSRSLAPQVGVQMNALKQTPRLNHVLTPRSSLPIRSSTSRVPTVVRAKWIGVRPPSAG